LENSRFFFISLFLSVKKKMVAKNIDIESFFVFLSVEFLLGICCVFLWDVMKCIGLLRKSIQSCHGDP